MNISQPDTLGADDLLRVCYNTFSSSTEQRLKFLELAKLILQMDTETPPSFEEPQAKLHLGRWRNVANITQQQLNNLANSLNSIDSKIRDDTLDKKDKLAEIINTINSQQQVLSEIKLEKKTLYNNIQAKTADLNIVIGDIDKLKQEISSLQQFDNTVDTFRRHNQQLTERYIQNGKDHTIEDITSFIAGASELLKQLLAEYRLFCRTRLGIAEAMNELDEPVAGLQAATNSLKDAIKAMTETEQMLVEQIKVQKVKDKVVQGRESNAR